MKNIIIIMSMTILCYCTACGHKTCTDKVCCKPSTVKGNSADSTALICKLTSAEQAAREEKLKATVFSKYEKMKELPDGLEFVYSDAKQYAPQLLDFITIERECCPFFTFNLKFESNSNRVSLIVGGSEQIKEMLKKEFVK